MKAGRLLREKMYSDALSNTWEGKFNSWVQRIASDRLNEEAKALPRVTFETAEERIEWQYRRFEELKALPEVRAEAARLAGGKK